jgi:cytochrome P450
MSTTASKTVERLTARYDHHDDEFTPDIAVEVHRAIQLTSPVAYSTAHGGMWLLSHYRDVKAVLKDHETFSSDEGVFFPKAPGTPKFAPLDYDRPEHTALRALMTPPLTQANVHHFTAPVTAMVTELLRPLVTRGHGDLATELAMPLAIRSVAHAIGFSADAQHRIRELTRNLWQHLPTDSGPGAFWPPFVALFADEIARARAHPGDDHLSALVRAELNGRPITDAELHSMLISYSMAGHETTMNVMSHMLWHLAGHRQVQDQLRADPSLVPAAAEEAVRLWSPIGNQTRVTTRDVVVAGVSIPQGARIMLLMSAANRDPCQFDEPDAFRVDRGPAAAHLAFGFGIHYCLGAHLARLEVQAVLDTLTRLPSYRLTAAPERRLENGRHIVVDTLPVRFDPAD